MHLAAIASHFFVGAPLAAPSGFFFAAFEVCLS
jgi:hypothetical protein